MANRYRAEVAVPELGDGFHLRLDWDGQAKLETQHGDDWWVKVMGGLERVSIKSIMDVCAVGLRDKDGKVIGKPVEWPDALVPKAMAGYCLDAVSLAQRNMTFAEIVAEATAQQEAVQKKILNGLAGETSSQILASIGAQQDGPKPNSGH